ncbi:hypothetical protein [Paenibacillus sp. OAS669]|uniref:hypothetical protein n=1 Tax=Paenibacillus sp. OAS669 TaxID=2663821 RepID=UPI00178ACFF3|nr:hypothetical protein [Paenibacillus sp. OAS669]MBE1445643.1 hypothetical protein [Paenibacillus sp. OAS669]
MDLLLELDKTRQTYRKMLNLNWVTILFTVVLEYLIHHLDPSGDEKSILSPLVLQAIG